MSWISIPAPVTGLRKLKRGLCAREAHRNNGGLAMTSEELIHRFENDAAPDSFHHTDHVRLAFAYLSQYPILDALQKFTNALKRFATAHGKTQLYSETITCAY